MVCSVCTHTRTHSHASTSSHAMRRCHCPQHTLSDKNNSIRWDLSKPDRRRQNLLRGQAHLESSCFLMTLLADVWLTDWPQHKADLYCSLVYRKNMIMIMIRTMIISQGLIHWQTGGMFDQISSLEFVSHSTERIMVWLELSPTHVLVEFMKSRADS